MTCMAVIWRCVTGSGGTERTGPGTWLSAVMAGIYEVMRLSGYCGSEREILDKAFREINVLLLG